MTNRIEGNCRSEESVICQLARMGDLVQMLPLITALSENSSLKLICDRAVEEWAERLPCFSQILTLDTRHWRAVSTEGNLVFPRMLEDLRLDLKSMFAPPGGRFYALNDHPVGDALSAWICNDDQSRWVNSRLILLRSYLRTITADRRWNRIHLSDLWRSLAGNKLQPKPPLIPVTPAGAQFADFALKPLRQAGTRRIWALILGSGGKYRRIEPEDFSKYWNCIPPNERPGLVLVGGKSEEELGRRFLQAAHSDISGILNLVGACSPQELLGLFSAVDLVIGVDTGPLHWAAAVGTKVLGIYFGEAGFYDTGPYGQDHLVLAPDCPEYPCGPEVAVRCGYRCRQPFDDHHSMAGLLVSAGQASSVAEISVPAGFRLHLSYLASEGNRYRAVDGKEDSPNVARFADFVRQVFAANSVFEGRDNSIDNISTDGTQTTFLSSPGENFNDDFGGLYCRWLKEIERFTLSGAVPGPISRGAKLEAFQYLKTQKAQFTAAEAGAAF